MARRIGIIFHGIGAPGRPVDPDEAPYWIGVDRFEALLDAVAKAPDRYRLSFDDGNLSDREIALPRLVSRGLHADFFVLTGRLNTPGSLGTEDIRALQEAGMGIGSHGVGHRDWRRLDPAGLRAELEESKAALERVCGRPVATAGIPFGGYNARVLRALRRAGYACAYSSDGGWMETEAFLRPRRSVRGDMDESAFADLLAGRLPPARRLRRALAMGLRRIV